tara:strand:- start:2225 stop:2506 length:282 start_codon:yes stop_codon:yes gene_type:complete
MVYDGAHLLKRAKVIRAGLVPVTMPFSIKMGVSCAASSSVGMTSSRVPLWLALEKDTETEPDNIASATLCWRVVNQEFDWSRRNPLMSLAIYK